MVRHPGGSLYRFEDKIQILTYRIAVPWPKRLVAGLSPWKTGLAPGSVRVGIVVDKVALEQGFLRVPLCTYITWVMNSRPAGCRSPETQCYPIDIKPLKPKLV